MENINKVFLKSLAKTDLTKEDILKLYINTDLSDLMFLANEIKKSFHHSKKVSWLIDRNVNITNVCVSGCLFCNFHCSTKSKKAYTTTIDEYKTKIEELIRLGGNQLLLQGGMNPDLDLEFYKTLFKDLKLQFPQLKLHALGPPEIVYLSKKSNKTYKETLIELLGAGLDTLPGAGAEILVDEVREKISKNKCTAQQWLDVVQEAHKLNIITTATMMFGHIETIEQRVEHLLKIRNLQSQKPKNAPGFVSFIPWSFQSKNSTLIKKYPNIKPISNTEYIRLFCIARIVLNNIPNIQPSLLTVGIDTAQICLHSGGNDLGSIMIEENVVSSAGNNFSIDSQKMIKIIEEAGFEPKLRNQKFELT